MNNKVKSLYFFAFAFFTSYFFYLLTLYPTVTTEDSGEFTTAVATLGIPHPSGYPLYVILAKIFTLMIPFGEMAWKVNLFSAFCAALSVGLCYLVIKLLTKHNLFSLLSALIFASGNFFWSQAIRAEVYSLHTLLFLSCFSLTIMWYQQRLIVPFTKPNTAHKKNKQKLASHHMAKDLVESSEPYNEESGFHLCKKFIPPRSILYLLCFLYGLSLGNHQLMLLSGPPLALFIFLTEPKLLKDWKFLLKASLFFLIGISIYLYLPIRANMNPDLNFGNPSNWENFWYHLSRKLYTDASLETPINLQASNGNTSGGFDMVVFFRYHLWQTGIYALSNFIKNFFGLLLFFFIPGLIWLFKNYRKLFWLSIFLLIFYSSILSIFIGLGFTDKLPVDYFKDRPFYITILLLLFLHCALGIFWFFQKISERKNIFLQRFFLSLLGIIALSGFLFNFHQNNQSSNYLAYDLANAMLYDLPLNSVLKVSNADNTLFPILYLNKVEGKRRDLTIYIPSPINVYHFFTSLTKTIEENPGKRIFSDFPFEAYNGKIYDYLGPISEIVDQPISDPSKVLTKLDNLQLRGFNADNLDHYNTYLKGRFFLDKALVYDRVDAQKQHELFQKAFENAPESKNIFVQLISNYYARSGKFLEALPYLEQAITYFPDDYGIHFQLFLAYILTDQDEKAFPYLAKLAQINKDLFLQDYELIKAHLLTDRGKFQRFEEYIKNSDISQKSGFTR